MNDYLKVINEEEKQQMEEFIVKMNSLHDSEKAKSKVIAKKKEKKTNKINYQKDLNKILSDTGASYSNPFDQIWLVFDNDDNEDQRNDFFTILFAQIKKFKHYINIVNIAYSNRQWEHWILLHFEKNNNPFLESECKDESDKKIKCGSSSVPTPPNCKGNICICGYLRENKLHTSYKKGDWRKENGGEGKPTRNYCYEGLFDTSVKDFLNVTQEQEKIVFDKIRTAIQNAEWLRNQQGNPLPENSQNPYTDVDKLVKILINK